MKTPSSEATESLCWPGRHQSGGKESTPLSPRGGCSVWLSCCLPPDPLAWVTVTLELTSPDHPGQCQPAYSMFSPVGFCTFLCQCFPFWLLHLLNPFWAVLKLSILFTSFYLSFDFFFHFFFLCQQLKSVWLHWSCPVGLWCPGT